MNGQTDESLDGYDRYKRQPKPKKRDLGPRIQAFFILNLAEHELLNAHKYKIIRNSAFFRLS